MKLHILQIDCIPPHIDHHDFSRPFCTISLLSQQSIMFGHKLIPLSAGEFVGATCESFLLPLPTGASQLMPSLHFLCRMPLPRQLTVDKGAWSGPSSRSLS